MQSLRLRFEGVVVESLPENQCRVTIHCSHGDQRFSASCEGPSIGDAPIGLAATATLEIVEVFTERLLKCSLEEFERTQAFGKDLIVLLVRVEHNESRVQLFGSYRTRGPESDCLAAGSRAALDATNRFVELVQRQLHPEA